MDIDTHGNILVSRRNERAWLTSDELTTTPIVGPTVTVFDAHTGSVLVEWGANTFAMPHGLTVDHEENVRLTDVAVAADGTVFVSGGYLDV